MIVSVDKEKFEGAVKKVYGMWSTQDIVPVYMCVFIECKGDQLSMSVTDGVIWAKTTVESGPFNVSGQALIDAKDFMALARKAPGNKVQLEVLDNNKLVFSSGPMKAEFSMLDSAVFPGPDEIEEEIFSIDGSVLSDSVNRVSVAAQRGAEKNIFSGILLEGSSEGLHLTATDSRRLATVLLPGKEVGHSWVAPSNQLKQATKALSEKVVSIRANKNKICFTTEDTVVFITTYDDRYPDWRRVFPENSTFTLTLDRKEAFDALSRIAVIEKGIPSAVSLNIEEAETTLVSSSVNSIGDLPSKIIEKLPCQASGERKNIFRSSYFLDCLRNMSSNDVVMKFNGDNELGPVLIEEGYWKYILMPIRDK